MTTAQIPDKGDEDDDDKDWTGLVIGVVVTGIVVFVIVALAVFSCSYKRPEPTEKKSPMTEEDNFGLVKFWQVKYASSTKK